MFAKIAVVALATTLAMGNGLTSTVYSSADCSGSGTTTNLTNVCDRIGTNQYQKFYSGGCSVCAMSQTYSGTDCSGTQGSRTVIPCGTCQLTRPRNLFQSAQYTLVSCGAVPTATVYSNSACTNAVANTNVALPINGCVRNTNGGSSRIWLAKCSKVNFKAFSDSSCTQETFSFRPTNVTTAGICVSQGSSSSVLINTTDLATCPALPTTSAPADTAGRLISKLWASTDCTGAETRADTTDRCSWAGGAFVKWYKSECALCLVTTVHATTDTSCTMNGTMGSREPCGVCFRHGSLWRINTCTKGGVTYQDYTDNACTTKSTGALNTLTLPNGCFAATVNGQSVGNGRRAVVKCEHTLNKVYTDRYCNQETFMFRANNNTLGGLCSAIDSVNAFSPLKSAIENGVDIASCPAPAGASIVSVAAAVAVAVLSVMF